MKTHSQLRKEAEKAPIFILAAFDTDRYVFLHKDTTLTNIKITDKISDAMPFRYGFDDEVIKEKAWSISAKMDFIAIPA
jgi:hypothetical protein